MNNELLNIAAELWQTGIIPVAALVYLLYRLPDSTIDRLVDLQDKLLKKLG